jgi:hypothetical protein
MHKAGHALPTSNGWSTTSGPGENDETLTVWCGRCKDSFTPDEDWVRLYYQRQRTREESQRDYYAKIGDPGVYEYNLGELAKDEQALLDRVVKIGREAA